MLAGPPGTGKTEALAAAISAALLAGGVRAARVAITSHTHSAIDNALLRFARRRRAYRDAAEAALGAGGGGALDAVFPCMGRMADKARWAASELQAVANEVHRFDAYYMPAW